MSAPTAMAPWGTRSDGQTGFLPKGSAVEQPPLPPVATVLASTDNSWDLEPRIGVVSDHDSGKSFASPVEAWDAHVYFDGSSAESVEAALSLRHEVCLAFPDITVNRPYRAPIGPHPTSMWSAELHTADQLAAFLPWLCTRNGSLSVLVHPNTGPGKAYDDHSINCYWLGDKIELNLDIMKPKQQAKL